MQRRRPLIIAILVVLVGVIGFYFLVPVMKPDKPKYSREAGRAVMDVTTTEFYQDLKRGKSDVNAVMGGRWYSIPMPIPERYKDKLIEKLIFIKSNESITKFTEMIIMDTYSKEAFLTVSSYLKVHARELHEKNPKGKIKVLHDGSKGIVYQFRIADDNGGTSYLEMGKVCMTTEGVFSVKYINKGTSNLEMQRQRFFSFLRKVS